MQFPLSLERDEWTRKINSFQMYSMQAEETAIPSLTEVNEILTRLLTLSLGDTLTEDSVEFFLTILMPEACTRIIKTRFYKDPTAFRLGNSILIQSVCLPARFHDLLERLPKLASLIPIVFQQDDPFFKNNNQMNYKDYPYMYFSESVNDFAKDLLVGDKIDIVKCQNKKCVWVTGDILDVYPDELRVRLPGINTNAFIYRKSAHIVAPAFTKAVTVNGWRDKLKIGDKVDAQDSYSTWFNATVTQITPGTATSEPQVTVTFKVDHPNGSKKGANGPYEGFADYTHTYNMSSPLIQPYCSVAKQLNYDSSKVAGDDLNDYEFYEINGEYIYAFPRKKNCNQVLFKAANKFGQHGGYQHILKKLEATMDFELLANYVKGIGSICPYLRRPVVEEQLKRLKEVVNKYLFSEECLQSKAYTKERSEAVFQGMRTLMKRLLSIALVEDYENTLKIHLVDICFMSEALKKKLQGLNELREMIRNLYYYPNFTPRITKWIQERGLFAKIYLNDTHEQLIKKSDSFFRFITTEGILSVPDLDCLMNMAQIADFETRQALYALLNDASHCFKLPHSEYLLSRITGTQIGSLTKEDLDLLIEVNRFCNDYPAKPIVEFFLRLIFHDQPLPICDFASVQFSNLIAKDQSLKTMRRQVISELVKKLSSNYCAKSVSILKGAFSMLGVGQWDKKDLALLVADERICEQVVAGISVHLYGKQKVPKQTSDAASDEAGQHKESEQSGSTTQKQPAETPHTSEEEETSDKNGEVFQPCYESAQLCLDFLLTIYKTTTQKQLDISLIRKLKNMFFKEKSLHEPFLKWLCEVTKCCQTTTNEDQIKDLEIFFEEVFTDEEISNMNEVSFQTAKILFMEINKGRKTITSNTQSSSYASSYSTGYSSFPSTVVNGYSSYYYSENKEPELRRNRGMSNLVFYNKLKLMVLYPKKQTVCTKAYDFFSLLYTSSKNKKSNSNQYIAEYFSLLKDAAEGGSFSVEHPNVIKMTFKIIGLIIDDSEKWNMLPIQSLSTKKQGERVKLTFANDSAFYSDQKKKIEVNCCATTTILQLRELISKDMEVKWNEVKIVGKEEITDLFNSRTIREMGLNPNENYKVVKRWSSLPPDEDLTIDDQLSPKAASVFTAIFNMYSTNGFMNKQECFRFTSNCINPQTALVYCEERIRDLYETYDEDKDGLLTLENFLKFYKNSAFERPQIVWFNLNNLGVDSNLRFNSNPSLNTFIENDNLDSQLSLPRSTLASNPETYATLFKLLKVKTAASPAYELLQRLPVSVEIQRQILSIGDQTDEANRQAASLDRMLDFSDSYEFHYKLHIVDYLITSNELISAQERGWVHKLLSLDGFAFFTKVFQVYLERLKAFVAEASQIQNKSSEQHSQQGKDKINIQVLQLLSSLLLELLIKGLITPKKAQALSLFCADLTMEQKRELLKNGTTTQEKDAIKTIVHQARQLQLKGLDTAHMTETFIVLLVQAWSYKADESLRLELIEKALKGLIILLVDQKSHQSFKAVLSTLIACSRHESKELKALYLFVLCVCFFSPQGQGEFIEELFHHISTHSISAEHFSTLALLVSKYGIHQLSVTDMPKILLNYQATSEDELTIEGCSRLLKYFSLKEFVTSDDVQRIWERCLFGANPKCRKESAREAIYSLIVNMSKENPQISLKSISLLKDTLNFFKSRSKLTSCTEVNQRSSHNYAGLKNLGNICYINSMMQQLYANEKFRELIMRVSDGKEEKVVDYKGQTLDDNILHQFQRMLAFMARTSRMDYSPLPFCCAYKPFGEPVNVMQQQDVQQFVSMFFDQLEAAIKDTPFKYVIDAFYGGKQVNLFKCRDCQQTKIIEEKFYSITLEVKSSKTLAESFNRFISGEVISDYRCDFCQKPVQVSRKTRISKAPKVLILHLQRMVFNLDTFINEKIATKHQFPQEFNLYPYSIDEYNAKEGETATSQDTLDYTLIGVICHNGNAQSGHYISYVKTGKNRWYEFNDSFVLGFNASSLEAQCFGGTTAQDDFSQFEWDKATENSKSAYLLLYERKGENKLELLVQNLEKKGQLLADLQLTEKEVIARLEANQQSRSQTDSRLNEGKLSEGPQQSKTPIKKSTEDRDHVSEAAPDDEQNSQKPIDVDGEGTPVSKADNSVAEQSPSKQAGLKEKFVLIDEDKIGTFISTNLMVEIQQDNLLNFYQRSIATAEFGLFTSQLLLMTPKYEQAAIFPVLKQLTFGFWMKSASFKHLLKTIMHFVNESTSLGQAIIADMDLVMLLLVENSDNEIRNNFGNFLVDLVHNYHQKISRPQEKLIFKGFMNSLLAELPNRVSKGWTKFRKYFEFWGDLAAKSAGLMNEIIDLEIVKHFLDYFLDKKSPLQIYAKKPHQIGSKHMNPQFGSLLKTIAYILSEKINRKIPFDNNESLLLNNYECLDKVIDESEQASVTLLQEVCRESVMFSEKVAIILMRYIQSLTFAGLEPYLKASIAYLQINDSLKPLRMKWLLGRPVLAIQEQKPYYYTSNDRIYYFYSPLGLERTMSLLESVAEMTQGTENYAILAIRGLLRICASDSDVRAYVGDLPSPREAYNTFYEFMDGFIQRLINDPYKSSVTSTYYTPNFNKEEITKNAAQLLQNVVQLEKVRALETRTLHLSKLAESERLQEEQRKAKRATIKSHSEDGEEQKLDVLKAVDKNEVTDKNPESGKAKKTKPLVKISTHSISASKADEVVEVYSVKVQSKKETKESNSNINGIVSADGEDDDQEESLLNGNGDDNRLSCKKSKSEDSCYQTSNVEVEEYITDAVDQDTADSFLAKKTYEKPKLKVQITPTQPGFKQIEMKDYPKKRGNRNVGYDQDEYGYQFDANKSEGSQQGATAIMSEDVARESELSVNVNDGTHSCSSHEDNYSLGDDKTVSSQNSYQVNQYDTVTGNYTNTVTHNVNSTYPSTSAANNKSTNFSNRNVTWNRKQVSRFNYEGLKVVLYEYQVDRWICTPLLIETDTQNAIPTKYRYQIHETLYCMAITSDNKENTRVIVADGVMDFNTRDSFLCSGTQTSLMPNHGELNPNQRVLGESQHQSIVAPQYLNTLLSLATSQLKVFETTYVWGKTIRKVFITQKMIDFPKWSIEDLFSKTTSHDHIRDYS